MAGKTEIDREALKPMIAMLLALALLAERLYAAPRPVRQLVMWILRPAEAIAREFVGEDAGAPAPPSLMFSEPDGDSPSGALRLAVCFRALAAVLSHIVTHAEDDCWQPCWPAQAAGDPAQIVARTSWWRAFAASDAAIFPPAALLDTS